MFRFHTHTAERVVNLTLAEWGLGNVRFLPLVEWMMMDSGEEGGRNDGHPKKKRPAREHREPSSSQSRESSRSHRSQSEQDAGVPMIKIGTAWYFTSLDVAYLAGQDEVFISYFVHRRGPPGRHDVCWFGSRLQGL